MGGDRKAVFLDLEFLSDIIDGARALLYDDEDCITKCIGPIFHDVPLNIPDEAIPRKVSPADQRAKMKQQQNIKVFP
jgi:hypothetical protein